MKRVIFTSVANAALLQSQPRLRPRMNGPRAKRQRGGGNVTTHTMHPPATMNNHYFQSVSGPTSVPAEQGPEQEPEFLEGADAVGNSCSSGQKDPLSEYKNEAFRAFGEMMGAMRSDVCSGLFRSSTNLAVFENMLSTLNNVAKTTGPESSGETGFDQFRSSPGGTGGPQASEAPEIAPIATPVVRDSPKVGRNDPCPCGNGKKYKKC